MSFPSSTIDSEEIDSEGLPQPNDVLLGRAACVSIQPGNIRYRHIINSNHKAYYACKTRLDRMIFIRQLTEKFLHEDRIKFWKREKKGAKWTVVDFKTVLSKISHALRDSKGCKEEESIAGSSMVTSHAEAANPATLSNHATLTNPAGLSQLDLAYRAGLPNIEASVALPTEYEQYLQKLRQQNTNDLMLQQTLLQERRRSANLPSMGNNFSALTTDFGTTRASNQPGASLFGGMPQLGLQNRLHPDPPLSDASLLSHENMRTLNIDPINPFLDVSSDFLTRRNSTDMLERRDSLERRLQNLKLKRLAELRLMAARAELKQAEDQLKNI